MARGSDVGGASDDGGRVRMGHSRPRECAGARHGPKRHPRAGTRGPSMEDSDCASMRRRRGAHHHGDEDRAKRTMAGNLRAQGRGRPLPPAPRATGRHSQPDRGDRTASTGPTHCRHGARHHIHTPPRCSGAIRRGTVGKRSDHDGQRAREAASAPIARSPAGKAGGPDGRTMDSLGNCSGHADYAGRRVHCHERRPTPGRASHRQIRVDRPQRHRARHALRRSGVASVSPRSGRRTRGRCVHDRNAEAGLRRSCPVTAWRRVCPRAHQSEHHGSGHDDRTNTTCLAVRRRAATRQ